MKRYKNGLMSRSNFPRLISSITLLGILLSGCSGSRIVQPLNQSEWQVSGSFGGPLVDKQGKEEFIPLSSVSAAYGFKQNLTGFASWQLSSYLANVYQFDAGYSHEILHPFYLQPGITYTPQLNVFYQHGFENFKLYPQLDVNAYWLLPNKDFVYTGLSNWFELSQTKAHGQPQDNHWLPAIHAGYSKYLNNYSATIELKYIDPLKKASSNIINFTNYNNKGAFGLYFSVAYRIK